MTHKYAEKLALAGTLVSAMGCAGCFPALGALGASLGVGFLAAYEGVLVNKWLPLFAAASMVFNLLYWLRHQVHLRGAVSLIGPAAVLATLYPLWQYAWSSYLLYAGLTLMMVVSIVDLIRPAKVATCQI